MFENSNISVSSIQEIISSQISMLNGFKTLQNGQNVPYVVIGALCSKKSTWYENDTWYYNVPLKDIDDQQKTIFLNIPKSVINRININGYELIRVAGCIKVIYFKDQFLCRLSVFDIKIVGEENPKLTSANKVFSSFFKNITLNRNNFPAHQNLSIAVVVPQTGSSFDEFSGQLEFNGRINIEIDKIPTNVQSKTDILNTLKNIVNNNAKFYNMLVIARGGGDTEALEIFDDLEICELVSSFKGYKTIGIGHSRDRSLLELVVDYASDTPTAAGSHINQLIQQAEGVRGKFIYESKQYYENQISTLQQASTRTSKRLKNFQFFIVLLLIIICSLLYYVSSELKVIRQNGNLQTVESQQSNNTKLPETQSEKTTVKKKHHN